MSGEARPQMKPPASVFGICNRIDTFYRLNEDKKQSERQSGPIPLWMAQSYTKVQWRLASRKVAVKFKVDLKELCKNLPKVMGVVKNDLQRMLFKKSDVKSRQQQKILKI